MIEKVFYVYRANFCKRSVNLFAALHPFAVLVSYSEKLHYREVISDHEVEAYGFLEPVEHCAFLARERIYKTNDLSVQKRRDSET